VRIALIAAMDRDRVIGRAGRLPWHLPADLAFFKRCTMGKPVIMGRKTHEAIGRPLPGRHNIVVSRDPGYHAPGCTCVTSLEAALAAAADAEEVMVIGGATLFEALLPRADRLYLTEVHAQVGGDTRFPPLDRQAWVQTWQEGHDADARNPYAYTFRILERRAAVSPFPR